MTDTANQKKAVTFIFDINNSKSPTETTINGTTFEIAPGSNNVNLYNATSVRSKAAVVPAHAATERAADANDDLTGATIGNATVEKTQADGVPFVSTTGVIKIKRRKPVVAAPAAVTSHRAKGKAKVRRTDHVAKHAKQTPSFFSELFTFEDIKANFPKNDFNIGQDTGNGWIVVDKPSPLARFMNGQSASYKVAKLVGDVEYRALVKAAKAEGANKALSGVHIAQENEVKNIFNAVADLVRKAPSAQAVWVDDAPANFGTTAISIAEKDKGNGLKVSKTGTKKNAGVLFATIKAI